MLTGEYVRNFVDTIKSKSYWKFVFLSSEGIKTVFAVFGASYLIFEALDFFNVYSRDAYGAWVFLILLVLSLISAIITKRPTNSVSVTGEKADTIIEVRVADIFTASGAVMVSTNTLFEADVAGGKIAQDSLQGQFTARYFVGNQDELIQKINDETSKLEGEPPFPIGTTVPVTTNRKTFYFTAMSDLNENGNAFTSVSNIEAALDGLWCHVRREGELQELAVPVIGTGRGRLKMSRKKTIARIAESYMEALEEGKIADKLVIVVRPEDASLFRANLYEIKDSLRHILGP